MKLNFTYIGAVVISLMICGARAQAADDPATINGGGPGGQNFYSPPIPGQSLNDSEHLGLTNPKGSTIYIPNSPLHPLGGAPSPENAPSLQPDTYDSTTTSVNR